MDPVEARILATLPPKTRTYAEDAIAAKSLSYADIARQNGVTRQSVRGALSKPHVAERIGALRQRRRDKAARDIDNLRGIKRRAVAQLICLLQSDALSVTETAAIIKVASEAEERQLRLDERSGDTEQRRESVLRSGAAKLDQALRVGKYLQRRECRTRGCSSGRVIEAVACDEER